MVTILSSERILPSEATPTAPLWLSNIDLAARNAHIALVYFYWAPPTGGHDSTGQEFFSVVESLKSSLARVLVPFYPLAGRLGVDRDGRAEVSCDGEGALFVVAEFDGRMDDLEPFAPSPEMKALFVPPAGRGHLPNPILMVQVTFFKCGGVALGTAMNHMLVDGRSAFHFMDSWSKTACGGPGNGDSLLPPSFDHTPLRARSVPRVMFDHSEYKSIGPPHSDILTTLHAISVQELSNKQVDALRLQCKGGGGDTAVRMARMSTFCAITTLVWRCFCVARKLDSESKSKLYTMIDMRNRMKPPLPPTYFGNAVIRTSVTESVRDVASSPINQLAKRVHEATKKGDDYARSLIDYLETADMSRDLPRGGVPRNELRVISWLGMPTLSADLGWGKPAFFAAVYYSGYVFLMDSLSKDGGVSVVVSLEPEILPEFERLFWEEIASLDVLN